MKKILGFISAFVIILQCLACPLCVSAESAPKLSGMNPALIYTIESDTLLYSRGGDTPVFPTSAVKLMTAALAIEYYGSDLDRYITVASGMLYGATGNSIGLRTNETAPARDILYAMIVGGANDCAHVLACDVAGTPAAFVEKMNEKAKELGMKNTVYTNPSGIHDDAMVTTVNDTLLLAKYVYSMSEFTDICGKGRYVMPKTNLTGQRTIISKNYFLSKLISGDYYNSSVTGMNAGSTSSGGLCLVASVAGADGLTYIAISMAAIPDIEVVTPEEDILDEQGNVIGQTNPVTKEIYTSYLQVETLVDWAEKSFSYRKVIDSSKAFCETEVRMGQGVDHIALMPVESLELYLENDVDIESKVKMDIRLDSEYMTAPVKAGDHAGTLVVSYDGDMTEIPLVARTSVEKSYSAYLLSTVGAFVRAPKFVLICIAVVFAAIVYIAVSATLRYRRRLEAKREFYKNAAEREDK